MEEKDMLKRAKDGDLAAIEWLLKSYCGLITAVAYSVCCDAELTRSAARLCMVKSGSELRKVKDENELPSWFALIARRESEKFMKQHTPREIPAGLAVEELREEIATAGGVDKVEPKRLEELVARCLLALPQPKRELLLLRYIYTSSYGEIGRVYGWDRYEVDEKIAEARRDLWKMLEVIGTTKPQVKKEEAKDIEAKKEEQKKEDEKPKEEKPKEEHPK
jgi:RNA polymerase sigma factor (sigma-70 family)